MSFTTYADLESLIKNFFQCLQHCHLKTQKTSTMYIQVKITLKTLKIIDFTRKTEFIIEQTTGILRKWKILLLFVDKCTRDKKYHKVRKHCHYTD